MRLVVLLLGLSVVNLVWAGHCSGVVTLTDTSILPQEPVPYSGTYPNFDGTSMTCGWILNATATGFPRISVSVMDSLSLKGIADGCPASYIAVYDGPDETHTRLTKWCGTASYSPVVTNGSVAYVKYYSDSSTPTYSYGFRLQWSGTNSPVRYYYNNEVIFVNVTSCNATLAPWPNAAQHDFGLPYSNLTWVIWAPKHVHLVLYPAYNSPAYLYDGYGKNAPLLGDPSGYYTTYHFVSSGSYLTIGYFPYEAFNAFVESLSVPSLVIPPTNSRVAPGDAAFMAYPNYPDGVTKYNAGAYVYWYSNNIEICPPHNRIRVNITYLDVEYSAGCTHDYVAVYAGASCFGTMVQRICGTLGGTWTGPVSFVVAASSVCVNFVSDGSNQGTGFVLTLTQFNELPPQCAIVGPNFYYNTTGLPLSAPLAWDNLNWHYPNATPCVWTITNPSGGPVMLSIAFYDLNMNAYSVTGDNLILYDGNSTAAPVLMDISMGRFSYNYLAPGPYTWVSSGPQAVVWFLGVATGCIVPGFGMSYDFLPSNTTQESIRYCVPAWSNPTTALRGTFWSTYPYGSSIPYTLDCYFSFDAGFGGYVNVTMFSIGFSSSDCLTLYDGQSTSSPPLATYNAGSSTPVPYLLSTGRYMYAHMHAGGVSMSQGFNASYQLVSPNCTDPGPPVAGSRVAGPGIITFTCMPGSTLKGNATMLCGPNGWRTPPPTCIFPNCTTPVTPKNATVVAHSAGISYLDYINFTCNAGFDMNGTLSATCIINGSLAMVWTPFPTCVPVYCPDPGVSPHLLRTGSSLRYDAVFNFSCETGYNLTGASTIRCLQSGAWNASLPLCPPVDCGDPGTPLNSAQLAPYGYTYPQVLIITCDDGFVVAGRPVLQCQATAEWDYPLPSCGLANCGDPGPALGGRKLSGTYYKYQGVVQYECYEGYYLVDGGLTIQCTGNGVWNATRPQCTPYNCSNSEVSAQLPYMDVSGLPDANTTIYYGTRVTFTCWTGYNLVGSAAMTCSIGGVWSSPVPACQVVTCPNVGPPGNGSLVLLTNTTYGGLAIYACGAGLNFVGGEGMATCMSSGQWSSPTPSCQVTNCGAPPDVANGDHSAGTYDFLTSVIYTCKTGYILVGEATMMCGPMGWTPAAPTCEVVTCGNPPALENGLYTCTSLQYHGVCQYGCTANYRLVGWATLTCGPYGNWSAEPPSCRLATSEPLAITIDGFLPALVPLAGGTLITVSGANWNLPILSMTLNGAALPDQDFGSSLDATSTEHRPGTMRALTQTPPASTVLFRSPTPTPAGYVTIVITDSYGMVASSDNVLYATDDCPTEGQYGTGKDCEPCPATAICPGGNRMWPKPGYWTPSETAGYVTACPEPTTRCLGYQSSGCQVQFTGPLCAECAVGYYAQGSDCVLCPSGDTGALLYVISGVFFLLMAIAVATLKDGPLSKVITAFKMLQLLRSAGQQSSSNLPNNLRTGYEYLALITFDYDFLKPSCGTSGIRASFATIFWGNLVLILCLVLPSLLILAVLFFTHRENRPFYVNRMYRTVLIYATLVYLIVSERALSAIHCIDIGSLQLVLAIDPSSTCNASATYIAGWILVIAFSVGLPCGLLVFLIRLGKRNALRDPVTLARYGYMYDDMRMHDWRYLFNVAPLFQLFLTAVAWNAIPNGPTAYYIVGASFAALMATVLILRPFQSPLFNVLYVVIYGASLLGVLLNLMTLPSLHLGRGALYTLVGVVGALVVALAIVTLFLSIRTARHEASIVAAAITEVNGARHRLSILNPICPKTLMTELDEKDISSASLALPPAYGDIARRDSDNELWADSIGDPLTAATRPTSLEVLARREDAERVASVSGLNEDGLKEDSMVSQTDVRLLRAIPGPILGST